MEEFYKDKAWELLISDIREIKDSQKELGTKIDSVEKKVNNILSYASGVGAAFGLIFSFIGTWVKDKFNI